MSSDSSDLAPLAAGCSTMVFAGLAATALYYRTGLTAPGAVCLTVATGLVVGFTVHRWQNWREVEQEAARRCERYLALLGDPAAARAARADLGFYFVEEIGHSRLGWAVWSAIAAVAMVASRMARYHDPRVFSLILGCYAVVMSIRAFLHHGKLRAHFKYIWRESPPPGTRRSGHRSYSGDEWVASVN